MSGLEAVSFLFLPIAAAILSWNDRCGFPDGVAVDETNNDYTARVPDYYGPREACPEILCSSSSSDDSVQSALSSYSSYYRQHRYMSGDIPNTTLFSLNSASYDDDDYDNDDKSWYQFSNGQRYQ
jgi:hypothetical protein